MEVSEVLPPSAVVEVLALFGIRQQEVFASQEVS